MQEDSEETTVTWNYADREVYLWSSNRAVISAIAKLKERHPERVEVKSLVASGSASKRCVDAVIDWDVIRAFPMAIKAKYKRV